MHYTWRGVIYEAAAQKSIKSQSGVEVSRWRALEKSFGVRFSWVAVGACAGTGRVVL